VGSVNHFQGSLLINSVVRKYYSLTTGTSVKVQGRMVKSLGKGQNFELAAKSVEILGKCDAEVCLLPFNVYLRLTGSKIGIPDPEESAYHGVSQGPRSF
jgi:hypothetical protein